MHKQVHVRHVLYCALVYFSQVHYAYVVQCLREADSSS